jgi:DNA-binding CsgD family transcriptional regulator
MSEAKLITETEKEICCRIAAGEVLNDIADVMGMPARTLDYRIKVLKKRFGANSITQLVVDLTTKGLLSE